MCISTEGIEVSNILTFIFYPVNKRLEYIINGPLEDYNSELQSLLNCINIKSLDLSNVYNK